MLVLLRIKNFALIDDLELEFKSGLNVLTGETGAGKSIILDAIDLVLGGKINPRFLRQGTTQGFIEATFRLSSLVEDYLLSEKIEPIEEGHLTCTREFTMTGDSLKSRSRVNGVLVNLQILKVLREQLIEITAQGQTVQLTNSQQQRELLDCYGGQQLLALRNEVAAAYQKYQKAKDELNVYLQSQKESLQRLDLVQFQLEELKLADLSQADELDLLEQENERLSHVLELQQLGYQVYQILYQNDHGHSVTDLLGQSSSLLEQMSKYDLELESSTEMIRSALNQVIEASNLINTYSDRLEADPNRLEEVQERIRLLKRISRKYGPTLAEVIAQYEALQEELESLTGKGTSQDELEDRLNKNYLILQEHSQRLSQLRKQTANKLEQDLMRELKPLAMDKVVFLCQFTDCNPSSFGSEEIEFYFSPNAGEKIQPLAVIASGGEMSRFLLALKACFAQYQNQSYSLIFDEIDAGVSGKVAQAISLKLSQLSQKHQVLCVTHQPLIAALADAHFRVAKDVIQENQQQRTVVRVEELIELQVRTQELAQLAGGNSAQDAVAFAQSLLKKASRKLR